MWLITKLSGFMNGCREFSGAEDKFQQKRKSYILYSSSCFGVLRFQDLHVKPLHLYITRQQKVFSYMTQGNKFNLSFLQIPCCALR